MIRLLSQQGFFFSLVFFFGVDNSALRDTADEFEYRQLLGDSCKKVLVFRFIYLNLMYLDMSNHTHSTAINLMIIYLY